MRPAVLIAAVAFTLGLAGCGDKEADQRKAFVTFLQTRILDKPGIHVPQLTADEREAFGPYAEHYAIITAFHATMNESVSPRLASAMSKGAISSIGDIVERRGDLETAKAAIDAMAAALGDDVARADAAYHKLAQPAEVKAVFDQAYDRLVVATAAAFSGIVPVADQVFAQALDLGAYMQQHRDRVSISGGSLRVSDPATLNAVNAKLQALQASQGAAQAAQARFQSFVYGRAP